MRHWLIKYAARRTSWEDILLAGRFVLRGVRNPQARNNLAAMRPGDRVLHYQSQDQQAVVGVLTVADAAFQDPTTTDPRWLSVAFRPEITFSTPLTLAAMRAAPLCAPLPLFRQPRLSVMPVPDALFRHILAQTTVGPALSAGQAVN
jgi:predicted RNA-binding protein with PUA-like domain